MPKVSVIIPCYNHGSYIDEAVDSVLAQTFPDFEIIIVNDGSTDQETVQKLADFNQPQTTVLHTANQGLAAARNSGIQNSTG
ncbi:MAG TPA: glycosyltransferase family A protein [Pyrinomonadaceae bacterium]|nr:glycosyltransferase family A protein [Pyrinomonadaceae bacterium]